MHAIAARLLATGTLLIAATLTICLALVQPASADEAAAMGGRVVALLSAVRFEPGMPPSPPTVSLSLETDQGLVTVELAPDAELRDADGTPFTLQDIMPATALRVYGTVEAPGQLLAQRLERADR